MEAGYQKLFMEEFVGASERFSAALGKLPGSTSTFFFLATETCLREQQPVGFWIMECCVWLDPTPLNPAARNLGDPAKHPVIITLEAFHVS